MIAQPPRRARLPPMPQFQSALAHYAILTAMLAPALLMAATASLLTSANARLARVVDRLRALMVSWEFDAPEDLVSNLQWFRQIPSLAFAAQLRAPA